MKLPKMAVAGAVFSLMLLTIQGTMQARDLKTIEKEAAASAAGQYCEQQGGVVQTRTAFYGTNGGTPLRLAGIKSFCQFTLAEDGSRIHVELGTLFTTKPTLAALAYYSKTEYQSGGQGNPASFYCTQLGGSDLFGGVNLAGGGWVKKGTTDMVLEACVFPDMSSIDSWGLLYHSADIIRGKDLDGTLNYPNPFLKTKP